MSKEFTIWHDMHEPAIEGQQILIILRDSQGLTYCTFAAGSISVLRNTHHAVKWAYSSEVIDYLLNTRDMLNTLIS